MFRIYLTNFGYFRQQTADTLTQAKRLCVETCFQSQVYKGDVLVGTWCPIVGWRDYQ